jgi:hypothetical protein
MNGWDRILMTVPVGYKMYPNKGPKLGGATTARNTESPGPVPCVDYLILS